MMFYRECQKFLPKIERWVIIVNTYEDEISAEDGSKDGLDPSNEAVYTYPAAAFIRIKDLSKTADGGKSCIGRER